MFQTVSKIKPCLRHERQKTWLVESVEYYQIHLFIVYDAFFRVTLINWAGSIRNENSCYVGLWETWFYNDAWQGSPWILDSEATQADVVRQKYGRGYLCVGVSSIEQFGLLVFRGRCFGLLCCREGTWEEEHLCGPVPWVITLHLLGSSDTCLSADSPRRCGSLERWSWRSKENWGSSQGPSLPDLAPLTE